MGGIHAYDLFPQLWARPRKLPGSNKQQRAINLKGGAGHSGLLIRSIQPAACGVSCSSFLAAEARNGRGYCPERRLHSRGKKLQ